MTSGEGPGMDVRPKKQYITGFLDQATSAIKLKLKHIAEANRRGCTITKVTEGGAIGLLIKIHDTKIGVKIPLEELCTQCYKEHLFGDKSRRKKIEQATFALLKPLVHSDFYTSYPNIYPYIVPKWKFNNKMVYIETDWLEPELQLTLGLQVRRPEGTLDSRLKVSDSLRWGLNSEGLAMIACSNMATANWIKSFEEKEDGVLMSGAKPTDVSCGMLYAFHKMYKAGTEDMPKPDGEGDLIMVAPVPSVFLVTTSKNYAGLCYLGKEVLRYVDDPDLITPKAMRMTEYVDEKGEKLQRFQLYRPNVTSQEGSVPENAEQLGLLSDAFENIRREKEKKNDTTKEAKDKECDIGHMGVTCESTQERVKNIEKTMQNLTKTARQDMQHLSKLEEKWEECDCASEHGGPCANQRLTNKIQTLNNRLKRTCREMQHLSHVVEESEEDVDKMIEKLEESCIFADETTKAGQKLDAAFPPESQVQSQANMLPEPNLTEIQENGKLSHLDKAELLPEEYFDARDAIIGFTQDCDATQNHFSVEKEAIYIPDADPKQANVTNSKRDIATSRIVYGSKSQDNKVSAEEKANPYNSLPQSYVDEETEAREDAFADLASGQFYVPDKKPAPAAELLEGTKDVHAFEKRSQAGHGVDYSSRRTSTLSVAVVPPIPRTLNDSDTSNHNVTVLDSSTSSEEDTTLTSWLKRCCSSDAAGRDRDRGRADRTAGTPSGVGMERRGSIASSRPVSNLPARLPLDNLGVIYGSVEGPNGGESTAQALDDERRDSGASGWGSWLGKMVEKKSPTRSSWSGKVKAQVLSFFGLKNEETQKVSDLTAAVADELHPLDTPVVLSPDEHLITYPTISESSRVRAPSPPGTTESPKESAGTLGREIRHCLDGTVDVVYGEDKWAQLFNGIGDSQRRYRVDPDPDRPGTTESPTESGGTSAGTLGREIRHCLDGTADVVYGEDNGHQLQQLSNGVGDTQRRYRIDPDPYMPVSTKGAYTTNCPSTTGYIGPSRKRRCGDGNMKCPPVQKGTASSVSKMADFQDGGDRGIVSTEPVSMAIAASMSTKWPSVKNALLKEGNKMGATTECDVFTKPKSEENGVKPGKQTVRRRLNIRVEAKGGCGVAKNKTAEEKVHRKGKTAKKRPTRIPVFLSATEAGVTEEAAKVASEIAEEKPIRTALCARLCFQCGVQTSAGTERKLRRCSGCGIAMYCSRVCQQKHRRQHKTKCQTLVCNREKFAIYIQL